MSFYIKEQQIFDPRRPRTLQKYFYILPVPDRYKTSNIARLSKNQLYILSADINVMSTMLKL